MLLLKDDLPLPLFNWTIIPMIKWTTVLFSLTENVATQRQMSIKVEFKNLKRRWNYMIIYEGSSQLASQIQYFTLIMLFYLFYKLLKIKLQQHLSIVFC